MRTFEFDDGKSQKFWNIELSGDSFTVTFGKLGTKGQQQTKSFPDAAKAQKEHDKLVAEKVKKGYRETTAGAAVTTPAAVTPLRQSMEDALAEHPDDLATYAAYGDYLHDQGDPRGEFVQVQLALEDADLAAAERAKLEKRQAELLKKHAKAWLGDLGRFLVGKWSGPDKPYHFAFRRGWLDHVRTLPFPDAVVAAVAKSPQARLLRTLEIVYDMRYHPFDFEEFSEGPTNALREDEENHPDMEDFEGGSYVPALLESPHLANLRVFRLGFSEGNADERPGHSTMIGVFEDCTAAEIITLMEKCPRLEELYLNACLNDIGDLFARPTLGNLRVLQYYYGNAYPLTALADNATAKNLTTLRFHAGRDGTVELAEMEAILRSRNLPKLEYLQVCLTTFGDAGCQSIVDSGILRRLKSLDLGYGAMTDAGARVLAASPDLKHLDRLVVTRNALTEDGIAALRATGVNVVADNQHPEGEDYYLYEVDFE